MSSPPWEVEVHDISQHGKSRSSCHVIKQNKNKNESEVSKKLKVSQKMKAKVKAKVKAKENVFTTGPVSRLNTLSLVLYHLVLSLVFTASFTSFTTGEVVEVAWWKGFFRGRGM